MIEYDDASSDKSSKYGSSISLRSGGASSITYDSTNQRYSINVTAGGESFKPIESCTGLDDFIIEFDGFLNYQSGTNQSLIGLTIYSDSNNWGRLGAKTGAIEYGNTVNGTYSESDITGTSAPNQTWLHFKFEITNNSIHRQIYNGTTLVYEDTRTYDSSWFNNNTKYGFPALWGTGWTQYFKNLKIKPL